MAKTEREARNPLARPSLYEQFLKEQGGEQPQGSAPAKGLYEQYLAESSGGSLKPGTKRPTNAFEAAARRAPKPETAVAEPESAVPAEPKAGRVSLAAREQPKPFTPPRRSEMLQGMLDRGVAGRAPRGPRPANPPGRGPAARLAAPPVQEPLQPAIARLNQDRKEREAAAAQPEPKKFVPSWAREFGKSAMRGALGSAALAPEAAAGFERIAGAHEMPQRLEQMAAGWRKKIDETFAGDPKLKRDFLRTVLPEAGGAFLGPILAAAGVAAATGAAPVAAAAGTTFGLGALFTGAGASASGREAEAAGADPVRSQLAAQGGGLIGAAYSIPSIRALGKINPAAAQTIGEILKSSAMRATKEGAIFATISGLGTAGQNALARALYDEDRHLGEGVNEAIARDGVAGFLTNFMMAGAGATYRRFGTQKGGRPGAGAGERGPEPRPSDDPYSALGVSRNATDADVHAAWRARAKEVGVAGVSGQDAGAEEALKNLNAAYAAVRASRKGFNPNRSRPRPAQGQEPAGPRVLTGDVEAPGEAPAEPQAAPEAPAPAGGRPERRQQSSAPQAAGQAPAQERRGIRRRIADFIDPGRARELQEAYTDPMTGVANQTAFEQARPRWDADEGTVVGVADVRNLKGANTYAGRESADEFLRYVAETMQERAQAHGIQARDIMRAGGDEFAVRGSSKEQVDRFLEDVKKAVGEHQIAGAPDGLSLGVRGGSGSNWDEANAAAEAAKKTETGARYREMGGPAAKKSGGAGGGEGGEGGSPQAPPTSSAPPAATPAVPPAAPKAAAAAERMVLPGGGDVQVRRSFVSASGLKPQGFGAPDSELGIQGRSYFGDDGLVNREEVERIVSNPDPSRLLDVGQSAAEGPPGVLPDMTGVTGNGRAWAIREIYQRGGPNADKLREAVRADMRRQGWSEQQIEAIPDPAPVRVLADEDPNDRQRLRQINAASDVPLGKAKSPLEEAGTRVRTLREAGEALSHFATTIRADESIRDYLGDKRGVEFMRALVRDGVVASHERARFFDAKGGATADGKNIIEATLRLTALGSPEVVSRAPANVLRKLDTSLPAIIRADRVRGWEIGPRIADALDLLAEARAKDLTLDDLASQVDLSGDSADPRTVRLARTLSGPQNAIRDALRKYADQAEEAGRSAQGTDMFGAQPKRPAEASEGLALGIPKERDFLSRLKPAGELVDGRRVGKKIDNLSSITSTLDTDEYVVLRGVHEVPMDAFVSRGAKDYYDAPSQRQVRDLAEKIGDSGLVTPLIVVVEDEGPYILEGGHRLSALAELGAKSFPAVVVDATTGDEPLAMGIPRDRGQRGLFGDEPAPPAPTEDERTRQGDLIGPPEGSMLAADLDRARTKVSRLEGAVQRGSATKAQVEAYREAQRIVRALEGRGKAPEEVVGQGKESGASEPEGERPLSLFAPGKEPIPFRQRQQPPKVEPLVSKGPAELKMPTPEQEPDATRRMSIARKLPESGLPAKMPTAAQEPDEGVRWWLAKRLPLDALPDQVPLMSKEPDPEVREMIAERIQERASNLSRPLQDVPRGTETEGAAKPASDAGPAEQMSLFLARMREAGDPMQTAFPLGEELTPEQAKQVYASEAKKAFGSVEKAAAAGAHAAKQAVRLARAQVPLRVSVEERIRVVAEARKRRSVDFVGQTLPTSDRDRNEAVRALFETIRGPVETHALIGVDASGKIVFQSVVSSGSPAAVLPTTKRGQGSKERNARVFKAAKDAGAVLIIEGHNHPPGDPSPSDGDVHAVYFGATDAAAQGLEYAHYVIDHYQYFVVQYDAGSGQVLGTRQHFQGHAAAGYEWLGDSENTVSPHQYPAAFKSLTKIPDGGALVLYVTMPETADERNAGYRHVLAAEPVSAEAVGRLDKWLEQRIRAVDAVAAVLVTDHDGTYNTAIRIGAELARGEQRRRSYGLEAVVHAKTRQAVSLGPSSILPPPGRVVARGRAAGPRRAEPAAAPVGRPGRGRLPGAGMGQPAQAGGAARGEAALGIPRARSNVGRPSQPKVTREARKPLDIAKVQQAIADLRAILPATMLTGSQRTITARPGLIDPATMRRMAHTAVRSGFDYSERRVQNAVRNLAQARTPTQLQNFIEAAIEALEQRAHKEAFARVREEFASVTFRGGERRLGRLAEAQWKAVRRPFVNPNTRKLGRSLLRRLSVDQLLQLRQTLEQIRATDRQRKAGIAAQRVAQQRQMISDALAEMTSSPIAKRDPDEDKLFQHFLTWGNVQPEVIYYALGDKFDDGALPKAWKRIWLDGSLEEQRLLQSFEDYLSNAVHQHIGVQLGKPEADEWHLKAHDWAGTTITSGEAVELLGAWRDPHQQVRFLNAGLTLPRSPQPTSLLLGTPEMLRYKPARKQAVRFVPTDQQMRDLKAMLPREDALAGELFSTFYNRTTKALINGATDRVLGYALATVENYYPGSADLSQVDRSIDPLENLAQLSNPTLLSRRHLQPRTGPAHPYKVGSALDTFMAHAAHTAKLSAYLEPATTFAAVLGKAQIREGIRTLVGPRGYERLVDALYRQTVPQQGEPSIVRQLVTTGTKSILAARVTTVAGQPFGLATAAGSYDGGSADLSWALSRSRGRKKAAKRAMLASAPGRERYTRFRAHALAGLSEQPISKYGRRPVTDALLAAMEAADKQTGMIRWLMAERKARREGAPDIAAATERNWAELTYRVEPSAIGGMMTGASAMARKTPATAPMVMMISGRAAEHSRVVEAWLRFRAGQYKRAAGLVAGSLGAAIGWMLVHEGAARLRERGDSKSHGGVLRRSSARLVLEMLDRLPVIGTVLRPAIMRAGGENALAQTVSMLEGVGQQAAQGMANLVQFIEDLLPGGRGSEPKALEHLGKFLKNAVLEPGALITGLPYSGPADAVKIVKGAKKQGGGRPQRGAPARRPRR